MLFYFAYRKTKKNPALQDSPPETGRVNAIISILILRSGYTLSQAARHCD